VSFRDAAFSGGAVHFDGSAFSDGEVAFGRAQFNDGAVSFDGATFGDGEVTFDQATFNGSQVSFDGAAFEGGVGRTTFRGARFRGGTVTFNLEDGQTERALAIVENAHSAEGPPMVAALARRAADLGRVDLARQMTGRALLSGKAIVLLKEIAQLAPAVARMLIDEI